MGDDITLWRRRACNALPACAIAETDGFRASESFQRDPDYTRVGTWYRVLDPDGQKAA
jgi:hypothetical protein